MKYRRFPRIFSAAAAIILLAISFTGIQARQLEAPAPPVDWQATANMAYRRSYHTLSVLPDGKALAVGGRYYDSGLSTQIYLKSSEIYDLLANAWSPAGEMSSPRSHHTATVLLDGRVLVTGGQNGNGILASTEIYDPVLSNWLPTGGMNVARYGHTATRLQDGRVLAVGGCTGTLACTRSAEIYDPGTGAWTLAAELPNGERMGHTATLLQDGSVLVAGGYLPVGTLPTYYSTAYRYIPAENRWVQTANDMMNGKRSQHSAVLLRSGQVLVVGGYRNAPIVGETYLDTSELYTPADNSWSTTGDNWKINYGRSRMSAVLDGQGNYILLGGYNGTAAWDAVYRDINNPSDTWHSSNYMASARMAAAAVMLPSGVILIAGGLNDSGSVVNTAEVTQFTTGTAENNGPYNVALQGLAFSSATMLPSGDIMITGGADEFDQVSKPCHTHVHLWLHDMEVMDDMPSLNVGRCGHTTTLLPDGRVVVMGGHSSTTSGSAVQGEIYQSGSWKLIARSPELPSPRTVLLPNGDLFVMDVDAAPHAYIFDPDAETFRQIADEYEGRYTAFTTTLMENGKVLIVGDATNGTIEVFDPQTEQFSTLPHTLTLNSHTALLLPDGRVMVMGGRAGAIPLRTVSLYNPAVNAWSTTGNLASAHGNHSAVLLPDGRPVVIGGMSGSSSASAAIEIYDYATGTWSAAGNLLNARSYHSTVLTLKGKLLTFGGIDQYDDPYRVVEQFAFANVSNTVNLWKPTITRAGCTDCLTQMRLELVGSGFTYAAEGSSGVTGQSAVNQPIVRIIRLDNYQMQWLKPGQAASDTHFLSIPLQDFPPGPAMVFVYTSGGFQGKVTMPNGRGFDVYLPLLRR
jgi:N-acetylneuraminic acid mutarotase